MFTYHQLESPATPRNELSASWATIECDASGVILDIFLDVVTILRGGLFGNAKIFLGVGKSPPPLLNLSSLVHLSRTNTLTVVGAAVVQIAPLTMMICDHSYIYRTM